MSKVVVGQAISGSLNGILAFVFRDSSGNATTVQLNPEGAVPVTLDAGTTLVGDATKVTAATLEGAGVGVRVPITSIDLSDTKTYTKLSANVVATRWTLFELVKIEDEGVVLDIFEDGEVIESTYAFYHELGIEEIKFESNESS